MNRKQMLQLLGILAVSAALVFLISTSANPARTGERQGEIGEGGVISLSIDGLYEDKEVEIEGDESVLEVLEKLDREDPALALQVEEYSGLGILVKGMGGLVNGAGGKYWQYEVNGVMPMISAGGYVLTDGDRVEWDFKESEF